MNIKSSYYFRLSKSSDKIISAIANLGHEIGYHYEDLAKANGNYERAIRSFQKNLEYLRQFYPIKTICMHGSPLSRWDNSLIWNKIDYKDYDIVGDPSFDLNFKRVAYLTDTGRKWNSGAESVRDKVRSAYVIDCKTTKCIIEKAKKGQLPDQILMNVHPQRWTANLGRWAFELIFQNIKNSIKKTVFQNVWRNNSVN